MKGLQNFSVKSQIINMLGFASPHESLCCNNSTLLLRPQSIHRQYVNTGACLHFIDCVPIKFYLWTLKSEICIIFICHKVFFSFYPNLSRI